MLNKSKLISNKSKTVPFDDVYIEQYKYFVDNKKKYILKYKSEKICRFCGKTQPNVKFKKDAHLIPQLLGNRTLVTNFECDSCNEKVFSIYESSLGAYTNPFRSIIQLKGQKGRKPTKHKEPSDNLSIYSEFGKTVIDIKDKNLIKKDSANKILSFDTTIPSYVPNHVYKILLKIGLCLLNDEDVKSYSTSIDYLMDLKNEKFKNFTTALLFKYFIPGPFIEYPAVVLFKRKGNDIRFPLHTLVLFFTNHIFQIFLPMQNTPKETIPKEITFLNFPVTIDKSYYDIYGKYVFNIEDLSSSIKTKNQIITQNIKFGSEQKII